jgi:hypothetical protein
LPENIFYPFLYRYGAFSNSTLLKIYTLVLVYKKEPIKGKKTLNFF